MKFKQHTDQNRTGGLRLIKINKLLENFDFIACKVNLIIEHAVTIALIGVFGMASIQVFSRYVINISYPWMGEAIEFLLAFIVFAAVSCLIRRRSLLSINLLANRLPLKIRYCISILSWFLMLFYFRILIIYGFSFALRAYGQLTPSQSFNLGAVRLMLPICGIIIFFQAFNNLIHDIIKLINIKIQNIPDQDD